MISLAVLRPICWIVGHYKIYNLHLGTLQFMQGKSKYKCSRRGEILNERN